MSATDPSRTAPPRPAARQSGTTAVEFAMIAFFFFSLVFGIIEVSRILYIFNTLQEVTRRAAAAAVNVYPRDTNAIDLLRQAAVFRDSPGELMLAAPVTDKYVRLDYLAYDLTPIPPSAWPNCAADNRQICMHNPHAANCIRFVQARICDATRTDDCHRARSETLVPFVSLDVPLPEANTIATVETLGYQPGTPPCSALPPGT